MRDKSTILALSGIAVSSALSWCDSASAQCQPQEVQKLLASDGADDDRFGHSVSISADTAIIGAYRDDDNGSNSGSAYIFEKVDGVWTQISKLVASDGAANDHFGLSTSIWFNTAVIGAPDDNDNGPQAGSAYVFEKIDGVWTETAKLLASDGIPFHAYGLAVGVSGQTAIVGAYFDEDNGVEAGAAYVFEKIDGKWQETSKLLASDGTQGDQFGFTLDMSEDTAVIGAVNDQPNGFQSGSAYVFEKIDGVWEEVIKLVPSDGAVDDSFSKSVSVSGDVIVIGASGDAGNEVNSGSAYVFEKIGGKWTQIARLTASNGAEFDAFGRSAGVSGEIVVIGATGSDANGPDVGLAYLFEKIDGKWTETAILAASDGWVSDFFGTVSVWGDTALISSPFDDDNGNQSGSAYIFELNCPETCPWDLDDNGSVGASDLLSLLAQWGTDGPADFDGSGTVGAGDLLALLANWGLCP